MEPPCRGCIHEYEDKDLSVSCRKCEARIAYAEWIRGDVELLPGYEVLPSPQNVFRPRNLEPEVECKWPYCKRLTRSKTGWCTSCRIRNAHRKKSGIPLDWPHMRMGAFQSKKEINEFIKEHINCHHSLIADLLQKHIKKLKASRNEKSASQV